MQRAVVCFLLCTLHTVRAQEPRVQDMLINFVRDNLEDLNRDFNKTDVIRGNSRLSASFEIGFVIRSMEECYRRMVDIYNSTLTTHLANWQAQTTDYIMFLKHVEMLHWVLDHLHRMLHEIEKKYWIKGAGMFETHTEFTTATTTRTKRRNRNRIGSEGLTMTTRFSPPPTRPVQTWWPLEYGWERTDGWR